ncbi:MAG: Mrp/NBP35 family ATP-binding protein [Anaerolineales bacterium]|nr:MAG: Mrp/NBP35 family ATP-binding protein [Anaerolineales bacterium]
MTSNPTEAQVMQALSHVIEPELHKDLVTLNMVRDLKISQGTVDFTIMLTTPACPLKNQMEEEARAAAMSIPGVKAVNVSFDASVPGDRRLLSKMDIGVKNAIAVASGKGGVGKSTMATNLALALAQSGATVGLLDADIYGPNIPLMMGVHERPRAANGRILPPQGYGIKLMSMGFLVEEDTPIIWRGPMIHSALRQFLSDVEWGDLDYLVVDLPPGTGDASLSLAQSLSLTGAIIVTTPQDVALADVVKGIGMFAHLEVPVLGVIENMSYFVCGHCGERTDIFSHGGGRVVARRMNVPFLGDVPIDPVVRAGGDSGEPVVISEPESPAAIAISEIATKVAAAISVQNMSSPLPIEFKADPSLPMLNS